MLSLPEPLGYSKNIVPLSQGTEKGNGALPDPWGKPQYWTTGWGQCPKQLLLPEVPGGGHAEAWRYHLPTPSVMLCLTPEESVLKEASQPQS